MIEICYSRLYLLRVWGGSSHLEVWRMSEGANWWWIGCDNSLVRVVLAKKGWLSRLLQGKRSDCVSICCFLESLQRLLMCLNKERKELRHIQTCCVSREGGEKGSGCPQNSDYQNKGSDVKPHRSYGKLSKQWSALLGLIWGGFGKEEKQSLQSSFLWLTA